jgi:di-trans,poly-cis-decaprenylcistransferase
MSSIEEKTKNNTKGIFNICINYGGQQEIVDSVKKVVEDVQNKKLDISKLDENKLYEYMYNNLGPMDLMIRTSGEQRISNYMIYELSYAELYFTSTFFPDFNSNEFEKAIDEFNRRNRRFGGN